MTRPAAIPEPARSIPACSARAARRLPVADVQASPVQGAPSPVSDARKTSWWRRGGFALLVVFIVIGLVWLGVRTSARKIDTSALTGPPGTAGDVGGAFMPVVHTPPPT